MKIISNFDQLITSPSTPLSNHLLNRYNDLGETEDDIPPIFIIVDDRDDGIARRSPTPMAITFGSTRAPVFSFGAKPLKQETHDDTI